MHKKDYIKFRKLNNIGAVCFHYMNEKLKKPMPVDIFQQFFPIFVQSQLNIDLGWVFDHYDTKFELQILHDKKGKLIKIIE